MVRTAAIALAVLLGCITGCAQLQVEVDILDPEYLREPGRQIALKDVLDRFEFASTDVAFQDADRLCKVYEDADRQLFDIREEWRAETEKCVEKNIREEELTDACQRRIDALPENLRENISFLSFLSKPGTYSRPLCAVEDVRYSRTGAAGAVVEKRGTIVSLAELGRQADFVGSDLPFDLRVSAAKEYYSILDAARREIDIRLQARTRELIEQTPDASVELPDGPNLEYTLAETLDRAEQRVLKATSAGTGRALLGDSGFTLVADQLAFLAVNADEEHWERRFNIARGTGIGGATDIVVTLNSTGDFSIKGLVFDARSTAAALQKLTISSLQILAAPTGAAFSVSGADSGNGESVSIFNNEVSLTRAELAVGDAEDTNYRASLKAVAFQIITTGENLKSPANGELEGSAEAEKNKQARTLAKTIYEARRLLIAPD